MKEEYPTKEEILGNFILHKPEVVKLVKKWKENNWKIARNKGINKKLISLDNLCNEICKIYNKEVILYYDPNALSSYYDCEKEMIVLTNKPSIIDTLHELAHHLFDADEHHACSWSIWLFIKTFPRSYARMYWDDHLLKIKNGKKQHSIQSRK